MSLEINSEDYERFNDFEKTILNLKEKNVNYKKDLEMEAKIKMAVLVEAFGIDRTKDFLSKIKVNEIELADQETYVQIYTFLLGSK